jgi:hypothetical protein
MNKLQRKWRSLFRKKNKRRRAKAAKHVNHRPSAATSSVSRATERTTTGARRRPAIGGEQRAEARRNQRAPAGGNQRAERGNNQRDPAQLAQRASAISKFLHLDPETMLKLPDADKKN